MTVHCIYDELVPTRQLKPNPQNPNIHPASQVALLAKILKETGWRSPIVVSNLSGYVVKGHGRLAAARKAGFEEVPVDFQDYESADEEHADLLADNKLSELSQTDTSLVKALLGDFGVDYDLSLTGYDKDSVAFINSAVKDAGVEEEEVEYPIVPKMDERHCAVVICCETEEDYFKVAQILSLGKSRSYKSPKVGNTSVISGKDFLERVS